MNDNQPWFRHKEFGYGAGLPLNWKGWALTAAYLVCLIAFPYPLQVYLGYPPGFEERLVTLAAITIPFILILRHKTDGGWRWRRGDEDS